MTWQRWCRTFILGCLVLLLSVGLPLNWLPKEASAATTAAEPTVSIEVATERLQAIAAEMRFIRFCSRSTCTFRDIEVKVIPTETGAPGYIGRIDAIMDRPSTMLDLAHYNFEFDSSDRWHLVSGEELSDVSSFSFNRDIYEVYSAYNGRTRTASLGESPESVRVGYRDLYYNVMDAGVERIIDSI